MRQCRKRNTVSPYLPPKKRICLDLNNYSIPSPTENKTTINTLSLTTIQESLSSLTTVQQNSNYSILATGQFQGPSDYFYVFPWLPKELQLQIWEIAAADIDAQIITISSDTERAKLPQQTTQYHQSSAYVQSETTFLRAQYMVPNILHACGDAREIILKYYRPVFAREIGGAPIYMAMAECRVPDTLLFNNLTALQMLRSRTQNFRVNKNDMDFITSAIVCTNIDKQPYKNPQNLRWITSSLRALDKLWIAEEEPCTCERHYRARSRALNLIQYTLADIMISQHATVQQRQTLARYTTHAEAINCVGDPDYCFTKWGFSVPEVKATSVNQLKYIAGQVVGRREQSRITLEYLQIILKESPMD